MVSFSLSFCLNVAIPECIGFKVCLSLCSHTSLTLSSACYLLFCPGLLPTSQGGGDQGFLENGVMGLDPQTGVQTE